MSVWISHLIVSFFVMKKIWCVCVRESWPLSVKFSISSVFYVVFLSGFTVTFEVVKAASKPGKRPSKLKLYFTSSIWLTILEILQRYFPFFLLTEITEQLELLLLQHASAFQLQVLIPITPPDDPNQTLETLSEYAIMLPKTWDSRRINSFWKMT